jgi:hypothetical protein
MNQQKTVIQGIADTISLIVEKLLGRRYYIVVAGTRGADPKRAGATFLCSYFFTTRAAALAHLESLGGSTSYYGIEVRSFRSRRLRQLLQ